MTKHHLLEKIGARIKKIRRKRNLTQGQLGAICHFEKATLSKIETGLVNMSYLTMYRLSQGLNISVAELVSDDKIAEHSWSFAKLANPTLIKDSVRKIPGPDLRGI